MTRQPTLRTLFGLRRRLADLLCLEEQPEGEGVLLGPVFQAQREDVRALLDEALPADLGRFLARAYPKGSLLARGPLSTGDATSQEATLSWHHEGEFLTGAEPERFIHPDLAGALSRALDAFIREDLLDVDDVLANPAGLAAFAARAGGVRVAGTRVIDLLARVEAARLALWRKPKLVVESRVCVCVGRIPRELWPEVACKKQRAEWRSLLGIDVAAGEAGLATLALHPTLPVDTAALDDVTAGRVLDALGPLDSALDGVLIEADNAHALRLLLPRFRGRVQCIYIDPPFNTEGRSLAYSDRLQRSSWLSFMEERLALARDLLAPDGTLYAHIDQHEKERLRLLLDRHLHYVAEIIWRIGWVSGFKTRANKFIRNHDTIYQYGRSKKPLFRKRFIPYPDGYVRRDGKPPTGQGFPLEDTWNCSETDRLDSIQIMSFSREKVGQGNLTQKNENLLERMLETSSRPGDWVLDFFLGSGTTAATAHKMGRRWIGVEAGAALRDHALPRMKRVLFGDRYGISKERGWKGGGAFQVLRLEGYEDAAANLLGEGKDAAPGQIAYRWDERGLRLEPAALSDPESARIRSARGPWQSVDLPESLAWALGLSVRRRVRGGQVDLVAGTDPNGIPVLAVWRRPNEKRSGPGLATSVRSLVEGLGWSDRTGRAFVNGPPGPLRRLLPDWEVSRTGPTIEALLRGH